MDEEWLVPMHVRTLQLGIEGIYPVYPLVMPLSSIFIETQVYILLVSRNSLHLFAIKSFKLPRVIETSA